MMQEEADLDLLQMSLGGEEDSDREDEEKAEKIARRNARLQQTEEAFEEQKASWKPICDLSQSQARRQWIPPQEDVIPDRDAALAWKWCAEDRYFLRDYPASSKFGAAALRCSELTEDEREELKLLIDRCAKKTQHKNGQVQELLSSSMDQISTRKEET